jgi:hypothetical protein
MRRLIPFLLIGSALAADTRGQLSVQLRAENDTYLLYESIPVAVGVRNGSGRTVEMETSGGQPWLSFLVTDGSDSLVGSVGQLQVGESVLIPPGQTVSRTIDILPLYDLRTRGSYRVQAMINVNGMQAISAPIKLTIVNGRELWSQTVGLPASEKGGDEYRTYSLVARISPRQDLLHICVKDEAHQLIYGLLPLGGFLTLTKPEARIDKQGHLHVLYQNGPRSFGYVHVDPYAKVVEHAAYSDFLSKPRLVTNNDDGITSVRGGEQVYPKPERVISNEEINPPKPEPPPKPGRWWWPFGRKNKPSIE